MADDEDTKDRGPWPFELIRRYDEVGPGLGRLYEARNRLTGTPALVLFPSDRVLWNPEGPWHAGLYYHPDPVCVTLDLERAPRSTDATDVVDGLVLMTAAGQRVEDNPRINAHFARRPKRRPRWASQRALAGLALLTLGLGSGWLLNGLSTSLSQPDVSQAEAPAYSDRQEPDPATVSYPMPAKPFRDQLAPPCLPREVEINGGCWVTLETKPPCGDTFAEHQGKCYLPLKKKDPVPQSNQH